MGNEVKVPKPNNDRMSCLLTRSCHPPSQLLKRIQLHMHPSRFQVINNLQTSATKLTKLARLMLIVATKVQAPSPGRAPPTLNSQISYLHCWKWISKRRSWERIWNSLWMEVHRRIWLWLMSTCRKLTNWYSQVKSKIILTFTKT